MSGGPSLGLAPFTVRIERAEEEESVDLAERPARVAPRQADHIADQAGGVLPGEAARDEQPVCSLGLQQARHDVGRDWGYRRGGQRLGDDRLRGRSDIDWDRGAFGLAGGRPRAPSGWSPGHRSGLSCAAVLCLASHHSSLFSVRSLYLNSRLHGLPARAPAGPVVPGTCDPTLLRSY